MEPAEKHAIKTEKQRYESCSVGYLREELNNWKDGCPQRVAIQEILAEREVEEKRTSLLASERQHRERQRLAYVAVMLSVTVAIVSAASSYFAGLSQRAQFDQRLTAIEQRLASPTATAVTMKPTTTAFPKEAAPAVTNLISKPSIAPSRSQAVQIQPSHNQSSNH